MRYYESDSVYRTEQGRRLVALVAVKITQVQALKVLYLCGREIKRTTSGYEIYSNVVLFFYKLK